MARAPQAEWTADGSPSSSKEIEPPRRQGRQGVPRMDERARKREQAGGVRPFKKVCVGQTFLSALVDVRRQECPRHSGAAPARLIGCGIGGVGGTVHKASEKYPTCSSLLLSPLIGTLHPLTLSLSTKRGDKVWRQGVPPGGERAAQRFYPLNCEPLCGRNNRPCPLPTATAYCTATATA
jgi:hypothetical protein